MEELAITIITSLAGCTGALAFKKIKLKRIETNEHSRAKTNNNRSNNFDMHNYYGMPKNNRR